MTIDDDFRGYSGFRVTESTAIFIALVTVAAAAGNMFVGYKLRKFDKSSTFNPNAYTQGFASSNASQNSNKYKASTHEPPHFNAQDDFAKAKAEYQQYANQYTAHTKTATTPVVSDIVARQLRQLDLPVSKLPSKGELKSAYNSLVLKYHPDTLPLNDPKKEEYSKHFVVISQSYKLLLKELDKET